MTPCETLAQAKKEVSQLGAGIAAQAQGFTVAHMEAEGYAGKTIDTRRNIVFFLLKKNAIAARIPRDEMPVVEEEVAVPYTELTKLFAAMNDEEEIRYKFFLGSGCRDKEVTFAAWNDIDFDKTYHVRRKENVGFTPKSLESRTIPLPDSLIALLRARRKNAPLERWLSSTKKAAQTITSFES